MDHQRIYERTVEINNPYRVVEKKLPCLAKIYRAAYDNAPLSNPSIFYRGKTLLRIAAYFLLKIPFLKPKNGVFVTIVRNEKHICTFNPKNTQFHAIYFDRFKKGYEPETCAALELIVNEKSIFCDIGSNWGFFTGYVGSKEKFNGHIYAFEPQESAFNDLSIFLREASLSKKTTRYQAALSDHNGYGSMYLKDGLHSGLAELVTKKSSKNTVSIKKLDDFPLDKIDIMKIDAEGHEHNILMGASLKIDIFRPVIIFEYIDTAKNAAASIKFLEHKAYDIFSLAWEEIENHKGTLRLKNFSSKPRYGKKLNLIAYPKEKTESFLQLFSTVQ